MADVYNMLSVPFAGVAGGNVAVSSLQFTNVVKGDGPQECDFLQIWNGDGYNAYYCYTDDGLWYNCDTDEPMSDDYADGIPAGTAMWYLAWVSDTREGTPSFTVSGAISDEDDVTFTLNCSSATMVDVYNMLGNPYPASWSPNNSDQCVIANIVKGDGPQECDFLQIWNGDGYNAYYCYADDGLWYNCDTDADLDDDYATGIPSGTAMWYLAWVADRAGDLTVTFKNPIK